MPDTIIIIILLVIAILGGSLGYFLAKLIDFKRNKKQLRNAIEVMEGKRENFIEIDGIKYDATKFKVRGDDGKEITIDLRKLIKENKENIKKNKNPKEKKILKK